METEQWGPAEKAYGALAVQEGLPIEARAYLDYARASALVYAGRDAEAAPLAARFSEAKSAYAHTLSYWRAQFMLAALDPKREYAILSQGALSCPVPALKAEFAMRSGQLDFSHGYFPLAAKRFTELAQATDPQTAIHRSCTQYLALIQRTQKRIDR